MGMHVCVSVPTCTRTSARTHTWESGVWTVSDGRVQGHGWCPSSSAVQLDKVRDEAL